MKIKDAIIIHGPGRSGTTLLSNILSLHSELGWISGYVNKYPELLGLSRLNRLQEITAFERFNRKRKKFPRPAEAYNFWLHYIPEFNTPSIERIDEENVARTCAAIRTILKVSGKKRFITKITGISRYQAIDAVFENPRIIWIDRDPVAVITSYYKQRWRYKDKPEVFLNTPSTQLLDEYATLYMHFRSEKEKLDRFKLKEVRYEALVADPFQFFKELCDFADLPFNSEFRSMVASWKIKKDTNTAHEKLFNEAELTYLNSLIEDL